MNEKINIKRIGVSTFVMTLLSTLLTIYPNPFYLINLIIDLFINMFGIKVSFRFKDIKLIIVGITYLYSVTFVFTKLYQIVDMLLLKHGLLALIISVCFFYMIIMIVYKYKMHTHKNTLYTVTLINEGISEDVKALYDTGNILCDYASGKPVSVIEKECFMKFKKNIRPEKYKIIPYRSIGKEHGIMEGLVIEEMTIWKKNQNIILKNAILACYNGKLSKDGSFQMILNQGLL